MTVAWAAAWVRAWCSAFSVGGSRAEVASSRIRSEDRRSNARATQNNCLCPPLKLAPPSNTSLSAARRQTFL